MIDNTTSLLLFVALQKVIHQYTHMHTIYTTTHRLPLQVYHHRRIHTNLQRPRSQNLRFLILCQVSRRYPLLLSAALRKAVMRPAPVGLHYFTVGLGCAFVLRVVSRDVESISATAGATLLVAEEVIVVVGASGVVEAGVVTDRVVVVAHDFPLCNSCVKARE